MPRQTPALPSALLTLVLATVPLWLAPVDAQTARRPTPIGAETITETRLREYLTFIAADGLEGRRTPSPGLDLAAAFLASHLARLDLRPAGDQGRFFQSIALTQRRLDVEKTTLAIGTRTLVPGEDFLPGEVPGVVEGQAVYVGNGTVIPARGVDPFRGLDVTGRIVVSHSGLPAGVSQQDLVGTRGTDWETTEDAARARGAIAVLFLPDYSALERWTAAWQGRRTRTSLTVDAFAGSGGASGLPTATLSARGVGALFAGQQVPPQEAFQRAVRREPAPPFALSTSAHVRLTIATVEEHLATSNVVAILEGRDPVLKQEYVAIGAHYDHLGTAETANADGDRIFNGADDDGSGTVALLAMAEAFATARVRPKRSILFVWHTGEERGLWGSRYFTEHPTVPLERVVGHLNMDMIGRSRAAGTAETGALALTDIDSVYVVGSRRISSTFGDVVANVNAGYLDLRLDLSLDDPADPAQIYERSDHYNYAKRGIPVAFFFTGLHADYHGLDDEIDRIDFPKLRRVTQTVYAIARTLADTP